MKTVAQAQIPLLQLLKELSPDSSNNTLRSWIEKGRVLVAGKVADRANQAVLAGQEVSVGPRVQFAPSDIKILFNDEHLVVLEKPPGLLSVATDFQQEHTVHTILKRQKRPGRVFPVHRLDRETSGVMIFAYSEEARDHLKEQFEKRMIEKIYIAIVEGQMKSHKGTWESFLEEDERYFVASTPSENRGKLAITFYEMIAQNSRYTSLRLKLQTGRKNQLRVHCSEAGFPIVGDKKYSARSNPLKRLCLHSHQISFTHPNLGKRMHFESPVPADFSHLI
jgi:tRNA pseudouridine32 synthase/23S rRNA pseudouridine746 synthase/23S rRNA pseudouridine1911/1915/1917 synthase